MNNPAAYVEQHHNAESLTTSTARLLEQLIQARQERDAALAMAVKLQQRLVVQQARIERLQAQLAMLACWRHRAKPRRKPHTDQLPLTLEQD